MQNICIPVDNTISFYTVVNVYKWSRHELQLLENEINTTRKFRNGHYRTREGEGDSIPQ